VYRPRATIKQDADNTPRIIPPSRARELVMKILEAADGAVSMSEIVDCASQKVILMRTTSLDSSPNPSEEGQPRPRSEMTQDTRSLSIPDSIKNDIDYLSRQIWDKIAQIERGRAKIKGTKILCLYCIPSAISSSSTNMEDFGPKSPVGDLVNDIRAVFREYLDFESDRDAMLPLEEIRKGVIQKINQFCSENGYKPALQTVKDVKGKL
jgi:hypothetical protein